MTEGKLKFVADDFMVKPCNGPEKLFTQMTSWELLNLRPETVLDLPTKLNEQYGITSTFLESVLDEYNIQTVGRNILEEKFSIDNPTKYFVSNTRHYSWPKGAGLSTPGAYIMHSRLTCLLR